MKIKTVWKWFSALIFNLPYYYRNVWLSDAPDRTSEQYKIASNLVKSMDDDSGSNSLNSRLNKRKRKHKVTDNRTGSVSKRLDKWKKRRRTRKQIEKCNEGNQHACLKLKAMENNDNFKVNSDLGML